MTFPSCLAGSIHQANDFAQRAHLINPMISGLKGAKMSSSIEGDSHSSVDYLACDQNTLAHNTENRQ